MVEKRTQPVWLQRNSSNYITAMRYLNLKVLGIIAIIGAPWELIDFIENGLYDRFELTSASGIRNIIFMTGWICSVLGLYKLHQPMSRGQKIVFWIQIILLTLANVWNLIEVFDPRTNSIIFSVLTIAWPLAGIFMIVTAIVIIMAKRLKGWKKYIPLFASFWFPQTMFLGLTKQLSYTYLVLSGVYAAISFALLGFSLIISTNEVRENR